MASFNLLTEPWIPVLHNSGLITEGSILEVLENAHNLLSISDPSPIVELGLYRLLTAFVMDAYGVSNLDDLICLLQEEVFNSNTVRGYVEEAGRNRFDLFDSERPFYQISKEEAENLQVQSVAALMRHLPSGSFDTHFHHIAEEGQEWSPATCARALASIPAFMTAGGRGYSPSINGNPPWYVLVRGKNLFQTIVLNCCGLTILGMDGDSPPAWRNSTRITPGAEAVCHSLLEGLTWQPRRVHLIPSDGGICTYTGRDSPVLVRKMGFGPGLKFRGEWIDPQVAYRITSNGSSPLRAREDREIWRDVGPLMLLRKGDYQSEKGKIRFSRPIVVDQFLMLRSDRVIPRNTALSVEVYGIRTDGKMKLFEWAQEKLSLSPRVAEDPTAAAAIQSNMDLAELIAYMLGWAIKMAYPREGKGNKKAFETLQWRAQRQYWALLRPVFEKDVVGAIAQGDVTDPDFIESVRYEWASSLVQQAKAVFDRTTESLYADAEAMKRVVNARRYLSAASASRLKRLRNDEQVEAEGGEKK